MADTDLLTHLSVILQPDPSRTVIRPFSPEDPAQFAVAGHPRARRIADRVLAMDADQRGRALAVLIPTLSERHRNVEALLLQRYDAVADTIGRDDVSHDQRLLIGAYFSAEYSFEAAALFNPSIVPHPDQEDLPEGGIRFVMALRGIGEGHVSSVTFRTGTWVPGDGDGDDAVVIDAPSLHGVPPRIEPRQEGDDDDVIRLSCDDSREASETVLFPVAPSQKQGIEDVRLVQFVEDDGTVRHLGTYTAYSGAEVRGEMLEAIDFNSFIMRPITGAVAGNKGMALFPRRIGGRYAMLGRQDNENIWFMTSDDLFRWDEAVRVVKPKYPWDFVQMGNCGSPIEIDAGWLVLTHGVGLVRSYCMGACLLDRDDPTKVLARTPEPILSPSLDERGGYVPNVVYSCGGMVHRDTLLLPYGVADNFTTFATVPVDRLLAAMV